MSNTQPKITTEQHSVITHALLKSWQPCTDGYKRFCELFPDGADLKTAVEGLAADGHDSWGKWLFDHCRQKGLFSEYVEKGYRNTGDRNTGHRNTGDQNTGHQNTGHQNTGDRNTGHRNTGHQNTGDRNTGDRNTGHQNTGDQNTGDRNTGDRNTGHRNTGDQNTGHRNTGDRNTGHQNTGHRNTGHRNTGDRNTGDRNTGHWNTGHWNTGYFNTITPEEVLAFNKPSKRTDWDNATIPDFLYFSLTEWVYDSDMTDQEKIDNPKFYVAGGYLKKLDYKAAFKAAWDEADAEDRALVEKLPNFDADLFLEISGIDVRVK